VDGRLRRCPKNGGLGYFIPPTADCVPGRRQEDTSSKEASSSPQPGNSVGSERSLFLDLHSQILELESYEFKIYNCQNLALYRFILYYTYKRVLNTVYWTF